jgi:hypothetical protein
MVADERPNEVDLITPGHSTLEKKWRGATAPVKVAPGYGAAAATAHAQGCTRGKARRQDEWRPAVQQVAPTAAVRPLQQMPFDLPPKARSPTLASSWQKALNYRDFQDKMLRVIQYSSRGIAFYLLRADPTHVLGTKLFNL